MARVGREFLMLAQDYKPSKHLIGGLYVSIKRDGMRAWWDGGVTRNVPKKRVPWANTAKDERYKVEQVSTGLWSRYGNVIHAPNWFLDQLPNNVTLDGELYLGRGRFQETRSIVSQLKPDERWREIEYLVFDAPSPKLVFTPGRINNPQFPEKWIDVYDCMEWFGAPAPETFFANTFAKLQQIDAGTHWRPMHQKQLPNDEASAQQILLKLLEEETNLGGEGLILRAPYSYWEPTRTTNLLKVKPLKDDEATVIGYKWGTGRLKGMMGSLLLEMKNGTVFNCGTGLDDLARTLTPIKGKVIPANNDGETVDTDEFTNTIFPVGTVVTFRYMGLTDAGMPREPRFWRKA